MTMSAIALDGPAVLDTATWLARRDRHARRVDDLVGDYLRGRRRGEKHPVIDFLFTYYASRPAHIRRWHPGHGVVLITSDDDRTARTATSELLVGRGYRQTTIGSTIGVTVDDAFLLGRRTHLRAASALLAATAARPRRLGCFGLHEWAMVYRDDAPRHDIPLRLGAAGTDRVVESMPLRCTHFDAFRFFTPSARPRNDQELTRADQLDHEQPGCLHATMDLYRTCFTLQPLLPAELTLDAFALALRARELDMCASPYDLRDHGYQPVPIETPTGRAEYVRRQTEIADAGAVLRARIGAHCAHLLATIDEN